VISSTEINQAQLPTRWHKKLPFHRKLELPLPFLYLPSVDTNSLAFGSFFIQQLVSPNHKKEKETSFRLITFSFDNGLQFLKVLISAVDYESHFDNKFSVDNLSAFINERFETSSEFDK
jgi:hypothetical protein